MLPKEHWIIFAKITNIGNIGNFRKAKKLLQNKNNIGKIEAGNKNIYKR